MFAAWGSEGTLFIPTEAVRRGSGRPHRLPGPAPGGEADPASRAPPATGRRVPGPRRVPDLVAGGDNDRRATPGDRGGAAVVRPVARVPAAQPLRPFGNARGDRLPIAGPASGISRPVHPPIGFPVGNVRCRVAGGRLGAVPAGCGRGVGAGRGRGWPAGTWAGRGWTAGRFRPDPASAARRAGVPDRRPGPGTRAGGGVGLPGLPWADGQVKVRGFRVEPRRGGGRPGVPPRPSGCGGGGQPARGRPGPPAGGVGGPAAGGGGRPRPETCGRSWPTGCRPTWCRRPSGWWPTCRGRRPGRLGGPGGPGGPRPRAAGGGRVGGPPGGAASSRRPWRPCSPTCWGWGGWAAGTGFFDLGGHSLSAAQVAARARRALGAEVPLRLVFEHPTVAGLAAAVAAAGGGRRAGAPSAPAPAGPAGPTVVRPGAAPSVPPTTRPGQHRLQYRNGNSRLRGRLDVSALGWALADVAGRHEALRTTFAAVGGRPVPRGRTPAAPGPAADRRVRRPPRGPGGGRPGRRPGLTSAGRSTWGRGRCGGPGRVRAGPRTTTPWWWPPTTSPATDGRSACWCGTSAAAYWASGWAAARAGPGA